MEDVFIISAARTAIGNLGGTLSAVRTDDLAAIVIKELLKQNPTIDPADIEDVILGCANQAGEDNRNVARMSSLLSGLPVTVGGETVNRLCASGMAAVINAARALNDQAGEIYIAGGVESMTRAPYVMSKSSAPFGRDVQLFDSAFGWRFINPRMKELYGVDGMGETAENLVDMYKISREDQDKFAFWSQQKAKSALESGRFAKEIVAIEIPQKKKDPIIFAVDEFMKPTTTLETLAGLRPAFRAQGGTVTAGNASGLNDGAAALLLANGAATKRNNLKPIARIVSAAVAGVEPRIMGIGPVPASEKALQRAGLSLRDMDIIEINEAFAAQVLACTRKMGLADDDPRINPNGGGISLGHPLGMTGARIIQTAALQLQETKKKYALVTLCIGVGQGYATVIERV
ncbi:MAG: acetyl-CoA C-acyltransferase [Crocinitomicaceae bacterium]|nr:acetyl-CoA C-acyltransferase [Crocinitomicaceae bacterium]